MDRIVRLVRATPNHGRHALLAFDAFHKEDGTRDEASSTFFVPNELVIDLAKTYPDVFVPVGSVHPYRKDAVAALESCAKAGVRLVKWLPNGMGIDPLSPLCEPFYEAMVKNDMVLLCHAGDENAVVADCQNFGNPLRLRAALRKGVRVIVAHCAGLGEDEDLDAPGHPVVSSFELFLRLMGEKEWEGKLFGEISATTLRNRIGTGVLETLLARKELHERLVNGSDYPLPGAKILIKLDRIVATGMITNHDRLILEELYDVNPLIFDFVIKRMLRGKNGERFPESVFEDRLGLLPR